MGNNPPGSPGNDPTAFGSTPHSFIDGQPLPTDGKVLIDEMYGEDSDMAKGIASVVDELENYGKDGIYIAKDPEAKMTKNEIAEAKRQKARITKAERTAKDDADAWLKKQIASKPVEKPKVEVELEEPPPPPPPIIMVYTGTKDPKAKGKAKAKAKGKMKNGALPEYYFLLGVEVDATSDEIKKAYRKAALEWHPDKNRERLEQATEMFKRINEAFDTLFDPEKRANYDEGKQATKGKAMKLQGHGWAHLADEDDETLTVWGWKMKRQSWRTYVFNYGRIDDDINNLVQSDDDPRAPEQKKKVFWRTLGEYAYLEREKGQKNWLQKFVEQCWKDTPSRWPKGPELATMNEASQYEWKERRMVYNRRKQKIQIWVEMHEQYLAIPNRKMKEIERMKKMRPAWVEATEVQFNYK